VRFAISTVAAVSGLLLLVLAFYGQPAVYLRHVQDQWDELMDRPVADRSAVAERGGSAEPTMQPKVVTSAPASKQEQRGFQRTTGGPPPSAALVPAPQTAPLATPEEALMADTSSQIASQSPTALVPSAATPPVSPTFPLRVPDEPRAGPAGPRVAASPQPGTPATPSVQIPERHEAAIEQATALPQPTKPEPPRSDQAKSEPAARVAEPRLDQAKSESAGKTAEARLEQARSEQSRSESQKLELSKPEPANSETSKPEMAKPSKVALAQRPVPAPPPLPQGGGQQPIVLRLAPQPPASPQASPQADDAQSVLARLRQLAPTSSQQADTSRTVEPRPRPAPSSVLPRLNAARVALSNGQIEDARRLLQQVQLQLVFGPVDAPGDTPPSASKSAVDVAHALDALSANEVPLSRRYIDVALGDLSGNPTNTPIQESDRRASGFAPAYPPR
jgi:hypothetical protein